MNKNKTPVAFALLLGLFVSLSQMVKAEDAPTDYRFRYSGSSIFSVPTGMCTSSAAYINDNKDSFCFISQSFGEFMEVSVLRRLSGYKKNVNLKTDESFFRLVRFFLKKVGKKFGQFKKLSYICSRKQNNGYGK